MRHRFLIGLSSLIVLIAWTLFPQRTYGQEVSEQGSYYVNRTADFKVNGKGNSANWQLAQWINITQRGVQETPMTTRVKMLYSKTGVYFLFDCQDKQITTSMTRDFMDLWTQDVVELFLWPDETSSTYFEYELSPLNFELPLLISNQQGDLVRWMPFHYDVNRKTVHETVIHAGKRVNHANIKGWIAEVYIPYKLLRPLNNILPKAGTKWRANFYRVDYDNNREVSWSWQKTGESFHDYQKFGTLLFK